MPLPVFDIRDREVVLTAQEIEAGYQQALRDDIQYIQPPDGIGPVIRIADVLEAHRQRNRRACETARMIEAIRAGYCSIEPRGAPPTSDARH